MHSSTVVLFTSSSIYRQYIVSVVVLVSMSLPNNGLYMRQHMNDERNHLDTTTTTKKKKELMNTTRSSSSTLFCVRAPYIDEYLSFACCLANDIPSVHYDSSRAQERKKQKSLVFVSVEYWQTLITHFQRKSISLIRTWKYFIISPSLFLMNIFLSIIFLFCSSDIFICNEIDRLFTCAFYCTKYCQWWIIVAFVR
jgi:hypothetical protein